MIDMGWSDILGLFVCASVNMVPTNYSMKAKQCQYFAVKPPLCISIWTCLAMLFVEICGSRDALDDIAGAQRSCVFVSLDSSLPSCAGRRRAVAVWFKSA